MLALALALALAAAAAATSHLLTAKRESKGGDSVRSCRRAALVIKRDLAAYNTAKSTCSVISSYTCV